MKKRKKKQEHAAHHHFPFGKAAVVKITIDGVGGVNLVSLGSGLETEVDREVG